MNERIGKRILGEEDCKGRGGKDDGKGGKMIGRNRTEEDQKRRKGDDGKEEEQKKKRRV